MNTNNPNQGADWENQTFIPPHNILEEPPNPNQELLKDTDHLEKYFMADTEIHKAKDQAKLLINWKESLCANSIFNRKIMVLSSDSDALQSICEKIAQRSIFHSLSHNTYLYCQIVGRDTIRVGKIGSDFYQQFKLDDLWVANQSQNFVND